MGVLEVGLGGTPVAPVDVRVCRRIEHGVGVVDRDGGGRFVGLGARGVVGARKVVAPSCAVHVVVKLMGSGGEIPTSHIPSSVLCEHGTLFMTLLTLA